MKKQIQKKGIIYHTSYTGNTLLACETIARLAKGISIEIADCAHGNPPSPDKYDFVGFATFTDYIAPHVRIRTFINSLPKQKGKPAFILTTNAGFSGRTLMTMRSWVKRKGFHVITGFSLSAPENYPPITAKGTTMLDNPSQKNLTAFRNWIDELQNIFDSETPAKLKGSFSSSRWSLLYPLLPRKSSKWMMGKKTINESLCTRCKICVKNCPAKAIEMKKLPVFDESKCLGCWSCYNTCPAAAIETKKLKGTGQYPKTAKEYREKLKSLA